MAKCDICGFWAGVFKKRHDDCIPVRASLEPLSSIETVVSTHSLLKGSATTKEEPAPTVGFSFDMQTNFSPPPSAFSIVDIVRKTTFIGASNQDVIAAATDITNSGGTHSEFCKWINENGGCDRYWAEMLFSTLSLAIYSNHHRLRNFELRESLPYWELSSMTTYCRSHSRLDGLVRRWDDPVWADLYPPNGWMCGCSVLAGTKADFSGAPHIRITDEIREKCKNWLDIDPADTVELLRPSRIIR